LALNREGLRLWLQSPAAHALQWAERTFPVFSVAAAKDVCPLAAPPRPAMLERLPPAPARQRGSAPVQGGLGGAVLTLGLVLLIAGRVRRRSL
ncbi:MAG TPA: hypothetical protein VKD28_12985, partial [Gemmatimonadales bacterium]|nr:hypothetical protein [Gemmatimonadales bacterium]